MVFCCKRTFFSLSSFRGTKEVDALFVPPFCTGGGGGGVCGGGAAWMGGAMGTYPSPSSFKFNAWISVDI